MSDLLSSASLLLAIVTVLYGLWYPEIIAAQSTQVSNHEVQRLLPFKKVSTTIVNRALPLTFVTCLIVAVFAWDAGLIIFHTASSFYKNGFLNTLENYNAVATAFVLVVCLSFYLAIHLIISTCKLYELKRKLAPSKSNK